MDSIYSTDSGLGSALGYSKEELVLVCSLCHCLNKSHAQHVAMLRLQLV